MPQIITSQDKLSSSPQKTATFFRTLQSARRVRVRENGLRGGLEFGEVYVRVDRAGGAAQRGGDGGGGRAAEREHRATDG